VVKELVSLQKARQDYGVVINPELRQVDAEATQKLRAEIACERGPAKTFDFGPPLEELLARCKEETGLEPPKPPQPLRWAVNRSKEKQAAQSYSCW
jgi:hypothetical protein